MQGFSNKITQLELLCIVKNIDVLCVTEHWCMESNIEHLNLPGYILATHFSRLFHIHGGCAIFVKNGLEFKEIHLKAFQLN